jgi:hypothetical protein
MSNTEIAKIDPKVLWQDGSRCSRNPWAYVNYCTPTGVEGRLVYDSSDDSFWFDLSSGNGPAGLPPELLQHMSALLPQGTACVLHDKHRRWNTADFIVGVDERLKWRH